jgi:HSP20 family protein
MQQRPGSLARQWQGSRPLQGQSGWTSPFALMRSLVQDMDRFVDDVWFNRPLVPLIEQDLDQGFGQGFGQGLGQGLWQPEIELRMQEGNVLVTADLPGMNREDVNLEVRDGNLIIEGERQQSSEQEQQGFYSSERRYGAFMRVIPLPEGADPAQAKARFENGVLEVRVPVEEESQQGHRIEVE